MPMYDEVGIIQEPYTFKIKNQSTEAMRYTLKLVEEETESPRLSTNLVKYGFTKNDDTTIDFLSRLEERNSILDSEILLSKQSISYELRLWIDSNVEDEEQIYGKTLRYKIEVDAIRIEVKDIVFETGSSEVVNFSKTFVLGEQYGELPTLTKEGHTFLGWYNEDNQKIEFNTIVSKTSSRLIAKWQANQFDLVFNANGGQIAITSKKINRNDTYGDLPIPTKQNYTFLGWYKSNGEKVEATTMVENNNHTLTARYGNYQEELLHGAYPVLTNNLVPVTISANGVVKKADLTTEWYNYGNQTWANAVVLENKNVQYNPGDIIKDNTKDNIQSYFVWIPRYKYTLFNTSDFGTVSTLTSKSQEIKITFENKNTALSEGTTNGQNYSHPAFQSFGGKNGFWVGKFESGYRGATTTAGAQINTADSTKLIIKPNTYSWRNITLGNAFKVSYDYLRNEESHMMKNMEWGAVAYLSHSLYGKNGEVYINNSSVFLTGCGGEGASTGATATCTNAYGSNTNNKYPQSTTGNISGVFDMSGGSWENVMGNTNKNAGSGGITGLYPDFFTNSKWVDYYDNYSSSSLTSYSSGKLGDATKEMGPFNSSHYSSWYNDLGYIPISHSSWFCRGGNSSQKTNAGIFNFEADDGLDQSLNISFRLVLIP